MKIIKEFPKFIWQLPQNILGLLVILFTHAEKRHHIALNLDFWATTQYRFGVSLGNFIILGGWYESTDIQHEHGHQIQSLYSGPLYLLVVGLPSAIRNIWDRIAHKSWSAKERTDWYYSGYPEKQADELGGVYR